MEISGFSISAQCGSAVDCHIFGVVPGGNVDVDGLVVVDGFVWVLSGVSRVLDVVVIVVVVIGRVMVGVGRIRVVGIVVVNVGPLGVVVWMGTTELG